MARRTTAADRMVHRRFAVELFNDTWKLLEKKRRTADEEDRMVNGAHASRYHWGIAGGPENWAIGEWQVSRVYAVLRRPEPALHHASRCLALCRRHRLGDFVLAYAHEALARTHAVAGHATD